MAVAARRNYLLTAVVALATASCMSVPTEEDPVYLMLTDLEARLSRIERVIDNQSLIELSTQVDRLQAQSRELRGDVETFRYESANGTDRQRQLYLDIDGRLQSLEVAQARATDLPPLAISDLETEESRPLIARPRVLAGSDQDNYQLAFDLLRNGRYVESAQAFDQFLAIFPSSPLADNAQYWLAETYFVQRQFTTALPTFQAVIDSYPDSSQLPDALLKIGFCNYELQQWDAARAALQRVAREFPDTTAARLASQRLDRLTQEQG
ncbi:MAG: tol-pal system protein YbgF [Gammaproteobacteria bacterium]